MTNASFGETNLTDATESFAPVSLVARLRINYSVAAMMVSAFFEIRTAAVMSAWQRAETSASISTGTVESEPPFSCDCCLERLREGYSLP